MDPNQLLAGKTEEIIRLVAPETLFQRFFSKPIPKEKIRQVLETVYGDGFADGAQVVAFQKALAK
jgi:hypothetical protein